MADVSCRMFEMYERGAQELGIPAERLLEGTTLSLEMLRNKRNRAPWDEWLVVCGNFEKAVGGPEAMRSWGYRVIEHDYTSVLRRLSGLLVRPSYLYQATIKWMAPVLYPHLEFSLSTRRNGLQITIEMPEPHPKAPAWFRLVEGTLVVLPRLLDLPDADVLAEVDNRRATYDLSLPTRRSRLSRLLGVTRMLSRPAAVIGVLEEVRRDVDEAYRAALASERDIRGLLQGLPDPVAVISDGRILETNKSWREVFAVPRDMTLRGRRFQTFFAPEDEERGAAMLEHLPSQEKVELLMQRLDGRTLVTECSVSTLLRYRGREAYVLIARDVTAKKERDAIFGVSQLGAMAAGIAHDINNPLTGVLGFLELLDETLEEAPLDQVTRDQATSHLAAVYEDAQRVAAIASDLMRFPRATDDDETEKSARVEDSLDAMTRLARNEIRHRAKLLRDYGDTPPVAVTPARLGQVLLNLIVNAAQAIPPGRAADNQIRLRTRCADEMVIVEISDTGAGIAQDDVKRVFEPFHSSKQSPNNAGLGLAISRRIVDDCGGRIELESELGAGTTFRLYLPTANGVENEPHVPATSPEPALRLKILVVDDERGIRDLLRRYLQHHEVEFAPSGRAALAALTANPLRDLILCDVMMPDLTGVEVHTRIKALSPQLAERFVFITGGAFGAETQAVLEDLPNQRLYKPFGRAEIAAVVRDAASHLSC